MATGPKNRSGAPEPGATGDHANRPARGARDHRDNANREPTGGSATPARAEPGSPAAEAAKGNASSTAAKDAQAAQ